MIHGNQAYNVCQDWVLSTVSIIQGSLGAPRTSSHDHTGVGTFAARTEVGVCCRACDSVSSVTARV